MSWPEEMSFIANSSKMDRHKGKLEYAGCCTKLCTNHVHIVTHIPIAAHSNSN